MYRAIHPAPFMFTMIVVICLCQVHIIFSKFSALFCAVMLLSLRQTNAKCLGLIILNIIVRVSSIIVVVQVTKDVQGDG